MVEDVSFGVGAGVGLEVVEDGLEGVVVLCALCVLAVFLFTAKARRTRRFLLLFVGLGGGALGADAFEEDGGWLVVRVLGHELAAKGLGEYGLM